MQQRVINPWTWQEPFVFVQGKEVSGAQRVLYCAGQASMDSNGNVLHQADMRAQMKQTLDNLETVLKAADMALSNVVRLNYFTTDIDKLLKEYDVIVERLNRAGCQCASTLLGVSRLAFPEMLVEIEATAVA